MFHVLLTSYEIVGKHLYELMKLVRGFRGWGRPGAELFCGRVEGVQPAILTSRSAVCALGLSEPAPPAQPHNPPPPLPQEWGALVVDEGHRLKNKQVRWGAAVSGGPARPARHRGDPP
jgi:hypothetical protein